MERKRQVSFIRSRRSATDGIDKRRYCARRSCRPARLFLRTHSMRIGMQ